MTTFALEFEFWIHICIKVNNLEFLKSAAHVNASVDWIKSISDKIQAIYNK